MTFFPLIFLAICIVVHFFQHKSTDKVSDKFSEIKLHPAFCAVGYITSAVFIAVGIFLYFYSGIEAAFVCFCFSIIADILILGYYGYSVIYDSKKISYRRFFGNYKTIHYRNIIDIEYGLDLIIRTKNDTLRIPNYTVNFKALYEYLSSIINLENKKTKYIIPRVRKFRDSVYRPGELYFALGLFLFLGVGFEILLAYLYFKGEVSLDDKSALIFVIIMSIVSIVIVPCYVVFAIISAKRAHSSKKWRKIACFLIKESYLKD